MDNKKILVVDDIEMNRKFLIVSFQANYQIFEASNGQEALDILQKEKIDIVISDIFMDVMDGYELIERMRDDKNLKHIPVIAITENECASQVRAMKAGADYFVSRPFANKQLEIAINKLITRSISTSLDHSYAEQSALLNSTIDNVPAGILVFRIYEGRFSIVAANPAICEIMGMDPAKALGADDQDVAMLTYPDDVPIVLDAAKKLSVPGSRAHFEYRNFYRSRRDYVWVSGDGYSVEQSDGSVFAYISFTDITDRMQLIEARTDLMAEKKANKAKSDFLSNMSHDIRTPLNAILNLTAMARDEVSNQTMLLADIDKISVASEFLLGLVNEILDMARIESGRIDLQPTVYPYQEFDDYIRSVIAPLCSKKDLSFHFEQKGQPMATYVDKTRLNQIFFNLLSNSVKYTPTGGAVKLQVTFYHPINNYLPADLVITDNGRGMSEGFQKKLFKPFERENTTDAFSGTGLGLVITKTIIDKMGGTILVDSVLGEGTTITVHLDLPVATDTQIKKYNRTKPLSNGDNSDHIEAICSGKRILIVEDHPLNQEIICRLLQKYDIETVCASNGQEGVDLFCAQEADYFDAILMDIRMPVLNGLEATAQIRRLDRSDALTIPIIAMTANAFVDDVMASEKAGMNGHLSKPVDPKLLFAMLCKCLGKQNHASLPKVLVVDDVETNAKIMAQTLQDSYDVTITSGGEEALEILKKCKDITAVITDIQMPVMNGIELVQTIRTNHKYDHIAILANTQFGDSAQEEVLIALGADDFVYKPTSPNVVRTRLKNILAKHRYERS